MTSQTVKKKSLQNNFGKLMGYNMRNIFLQKSCRKLGRETSSSPPYVFFKKALYEVTANS